MELNSNSTNIVSNSISLVDILSCVKLVEECEPHLTKEDQRLYFQRLENEYPNICRVLTYCTQQSTDDNVSYALQLIGIVTF